MIRQRVTNQANKASLKHATGRKMTQQEKLIHCQIYHLSTVSHKTACCRERQNQTDSVLKSSGRDWMFFFFFFRSSLQNFPKSFYYVLSSHFDTFRCRVNHSTEIYKDKEKNFLSYQEIVLSNIQVSILTCQWSTGEFHRCKHLCLLYTGIYGSY